jgi:asparagine synthase (glutamine-hydrolysing)
MLFGAIIGNDEYVAEWKATMNQHGSWLGLVTCIETRRLSIGQTFAFGWLHIPEAIVDMPMRETREHLLISTWGEVREGEQRIATEQSLQELIIRADSNLIQLGVSLHTGELIVSIPLATPEQFYYSKDYRGCVFANDMRLMIQWSGLDLDERAIYALLQYSAIPATLTISKKVHRIPNGHSLKLFPAADSPVISPLLQPGKKLSTERNVDDPADRVQQTLARTLGRAPAPSVLYFSGGVDSGLMAALLADIGRTDVQLINFIFGQHDPEGGLAMRMAKHLGLDCEQIVYDPGDVRFVLERIARDYSFPFGDDSVIPTNLLVHASLRSISPGCTVIEGTGADGAFGNWMPRPKMSAVPKPVRYMLSEAYKWLGIWRYDTAMEYRGQNARQSLRMPRSHVEVIAQNALDGIAYDIPNVTRHFLTETIRDRIDILGVGLDEEEQYSLLDLIYVCAGRFAVKSFEPLRMNGIKSFYPFLEPDMLNLSLSLHHTIKCERGESKSILKNLAIRHIPPEMIYRPKSGFTPPFKQILASPGMRHFVNDVVLSPYNPLLEFCHTNVIRQMFKRADEQQSLSDGAHKFLWALVFTSLWVSQLEHRA